MYSVKHGPFWVSGVGDGGLWAISARPQSGALISLGGFLSLNIGLRKAGAIFNKNMKRVYPGRGISGPLCIQLLVFIIAVHISLINKLLLQGIYYV